MVEPLRHRQTKGAATDMFNLTPPRHISTLREADSRGPKSANAVTKGENQPFPKISQKWSLLKTRPRLLARAELRGRFLVNRCGSLSSLRAERTSGPEKFSRQPKETFSPLPAKSGSVGLLHCE
jgi:hypothetical protein